MAETTPTHRIKVGLVDVAIWANTGKTGTFYNVTASRSFKQGDDWNFCAREPVLSRPSA